MDDTISSGALRLSAHLATPPAPGRGIGLVLCHGLPNGPRGAATVGTTYPDLADRLARDGGLVVLTFNFRGTGTSEGDFSIAGWIDDLWAAVRILHARDDVDGVWTAGVGHGGTVALCEAASDDLVRGVATLAAPAVLRDWAREPARFVALAARWGCSGPRGIRRISAAGYAKSPVSTRFGPRPGYLRAPCSCSTVSTTWRCHRPRRAMIADAAGDGVELRLVHGAGHRLRHDPAPSPRCSDGWSGKSPDRWVTDSAGHARVREHVRERLIQWDRGLPAGRGAELGRVPDHHGHVDGRASSVSSTSSSGRAAAREQRRGQVADGEADTGAHVVGLARCAVLGEEAVGAHDVAHVGHVAHGPTVSDRDGGGPVLLGSGDARCEARHQEARRLAGTGVVERPNGDDGHAIAASGFERELLGAHLALAVGGEWLPRMCLRHRRVVATPYCSALPTTITISTPTDPQASTTLRVPATFTASSPVDPHESPT